MKKMKRKVGLVGLAVVVAVAMVLMSVVPVAASPDPAVNSVDVLSPSSAYTGGVPAMGWSGGYFTTTFVANVTETGLYQVAIIGPDHPTGGPPSKCWAFAEVVQLNAGENTITRLITISPAMPEGLYDFNVTVGPASGFPTGAVTDSVVAGVAIGPVPGGNIAMVLGAKTIVIVEAILDQLVTPSKINDLIITGNANEALTPTGQNLINGIGTLVGDGVGMVGGVVSNIKGAVVSKVPDLVNGALSMFSEFIKLFSTDVHMAP